MSRPMKDSGVEWIGEVPESWEVAKLKRSVLQVIGGIWGDEAIGDENDINCVRIADFDRAKSRLKGTKLTVRNIPIEKQENFLLRKGDLLIEKSGGGEKTPVGSVILYDRDESAVFTNFIGRIRLNDNVADSCFFTYLHASLFSNRITLRSIKQTTGIQNLDINYYLRESVPYPTLTEQQKIVTFLDEKTFQIDSIIDDTKQSVLEFKKYKQALITETVTKGLNPDAKKKDSGVEWIGEIPEHWVCSKIKYITSLSRGQFSHRPRNDERFYDGVYPFIQTGDVAKANKFITSYSQTLNELGKGVSKEFPKGTLVMTIAANVGDVAVLGFDSYFPDSVIGFVPNNGYYWNYLYYLFSAMKPTFVNTAIVSTQLNLNIERIKEISIPTTINSDEQQQIADFLDEKCAHIDSLIADKEKLISEFEDYKTSLIYEYVTGKKAVE